MPVLAVWGQTTVTRTSADNPDKWISTHFQANKLPPFSFAYNEISSSKYIDTWTFSKRKVATGNPRIVNYIITYTDPESKLQAICNVKGYADYGAVEWVLSFKNPTRKDSFKITGIRSADYKVSEPGANGFKVRYLEGCNNDVTDYAVRQFDLTSNTSRHFVPIGGFSADGSSLPFYEVISKSTGSGVAVAIGWSGTWNCDLIGVSSGEFRVHAGLENANFILKPGEEVRTPLVATVFWGGGEMEGHNALRRFITACHSGRNGAAPLLCGGFDLGDPGQFDDYALLTDDIAKGIVRRYSQLKLSPDALFLGPGWAEGVSGPAYDGSARWNEDAGSWNADTERFAGGLAPVASLVQSYGGKFMLWIEPEIVMAGSLIHREHPEFLLKSKEGGDQCFLFNLADPKACDYLCKYVGDIVEKEKVDCLCLDCCIAPEYFWRGNDPYGRVGISEIKYVTGLYRFWDYLSNRFPNLRLTTRLEGGSRIDLEALSRTSVLNRSACREPLAQQCHHYGLSLFVPMHGTQTFVAEPYEARSAYSPLVTTHYEMLTNKSVGSTAMRAIQDELKGIRHYFLKDYYPLSGFGNVTDKDIWLAMQYHDPCDGSGIVLAFRREQAADDRYIVKLQGVLPDATYVVTDVDSGESKTVRGSELLGGITLWLENPRSSVLLKYKMKA
ncbi:MAG: alpha-galactosidase [Bacteroidales bacterium]|nr:alpha-galactosidase [Bacteroidales bacterium]